MAVLTTEPLDRLLDYLAPEGGVNLGDFVAVPLGPRLVFGVVWSHGEGKFDPSKIRAVNRVLDMQGMSSVMRAFLTRVGEYTLTPLEAMLRLATRVPGLGEPPGSRKVLRRGLGEPERMSPARARVLEVMADYGGLGFAPGELAELAGVSGSLAGRLRKRGRCATCPTRHWILVPARWFCRRNKRLLRRRCEHAFWRAAIPRPC